MAFLDFLFGKGEKTKQIPRFSQQQQGALDQILAQSQGALQPAFQNIMNLLSQDPEAMKAFEAPAMRQFQEEILPTIAERFTSTLGEGSERSSAFGQQLGAAGAGLAENLAAQRAGLSNQAISQLFSLLGLGLSPQFDTIYQPKQAGLAQNFASGMAPGLGALFSGRFI